MGVSSRLITVNMKLLTHFVRETKEDLEIHFVIPLFLNAFTFESLDKIKIEFEFTVHLQGICIHTKCLVIHSEMYVTSSYPPSLSF